MSIRTITKKGSSVGGAEIGGLDTYAVGMQLTNQTSGTATKPEAQGAAEIVQITYDLVHTSGANSVTETAIGGRTDWTNDTNATGVRNGTNASIAGNAAGVRGGQLEFGFADLVNKAELAITSVTLKFYVRQAGTVLNNGDLKLKWRKDAGAFVVLETVTGDINDLAAGRSFDISASITGWSDLDALQAAVSFEAALGELQTADCDAVEVVIVATVTDAL